MTTQADQAIPPNAFIGKPEKPTDEELAAVLGPAQALWDQLLADLAAEHGVAIQEWNSYSPKAGWALRLKRGKRNIVYLSPCQGRFMASFVLGGKAVEAARQGGLPPRLIRILDEAKRYPEGTVLRIRVAKPPDAAIVAKLAALKLKY
jgi:hypothetical protein